MTELPSLNLKYEFERIDYACRVAGADIEVHLDAVSNFEKVVDEAADQLASAGVSDFHPTHCPYFGVLWPSARVLTDVLVSELDSGRPRVLELGCGLALPSLVLAQLGCDVWAVDHHPDVENLLQRNAKLNSVGEIARFVRADWATLSYCAELANEKFNWIIASDILYEAKMVDEVVRAIDYLARNHLHPRGEIWVADPGRAHLQIFVNQMKDALIAESQDGDASSGRQIIYDTYVRDEIFILRWKL